MGIFKRLEERLEKRFFSSKYDVKYDYLFTLNHDDLARNLESYDSLNKKNESHLENSMFISIMMAMSMPALFTWIWPYAELGVLLLALTIAAAVVLIIPNWRFASAPRRMFTREWTAISDLQTEFNLGQIGSDSTIRRMIDYVARNGNFNLELNGMLSKISKKSNWSYDESALLFEALLPVMYVIKNTGTIDEETIDGLDEITGIRSKIKNLYEECNVRSDVNRKSEGEAMESVKTVLDEKKSRNEFLDSSADYRRLKDMTRRLIDYTDSLKSKVQLASS